MKDYLRAVWRCRYFWLSLVQMDLRTRYRRSLLGLGWSLLNPLAMTAIFCLVFYKAFSGEDGVARYAAYVVGGLACWQFLVNVTLQGCQCFYRGEAYIRQHPAPLAIYPLRTALGGLIHFLLALAVVTVLTWCVQGLHNVPYLLTLLPSVLLLSVFAWSLAVLAGFATVHFNDTQHLAEIGFQLLFYATPVMYKADLLRDNHLGWLVKCNPFLPFLDLVREPVLLNRLPPTMTVVTACGVAAATFLAAAVTLTRLERRLIFHL